MKYAICQIYGKEYKIEPGQAFEVDKKLNGKEINVKALLISEDGKLKMGKPFLKDELTLTVLENIRGDKIRVGKYHSKANYRRVTGQRSEKTRVVWNVKSS